MFGTISTFQTHPKSQHQRVNLIFSLSILFPISWVKPMADNYFLNKNHICTLTKQNGMDCSTVYNTYCNKKKWSSIFCQWAIPAASKRLTCMGRACYLHQFWKGAEVTSESYSGEFLPQLHTRTVYILKHEVSWASPILWHAYSFPHS